MVQSAQLSPQQLATLERIQLVVFDVDGTLTDGRVLYDDRGELQQFDVHDGQGLAWLHKAGLQLSWITGRGCPATQARARELGVQELHMRSGPKAEVLRAVQARLGLARDQTLAMGDDLPDLALAQESAFFAAPADARPEVRQQADWVSSFNAGHGAARELSELLLRAKGLWKGLLVTYGIDS